MKYDIDTLLPYDAFKKDPLGRIKLHGGGGGGGDSYNPLKDKQYKIEKAYLDTLKSDIAKNNVKMTPEQIMAALSPSQRNIIGQQAQPAAVPNMDMWGQFNSFPQQQPQAPIVPQAPVQPMGQFGYDPQSILAIQQLLANSSLLPSASKIGGK